MGGVAGDSLIRKLGDRISNHKQKAEEKEKQVLRILLGGGGNVRP